MNAATSLVCALGLVLLLLPLSGARSAPAEGGGDRDEDLLGKALQRVEDLYLHPEVIDPASMAREGIQAMERAAPDILVLEADSSALRLRSAGREKTLLLTDVDSMAAVEAQLRSAADFIAAERTDELTTDDLYVEALSGVLGTIDRHSRLIVGGRLDEFNTRFKGTLVGIGARIGRRQGMLRIVEPFPNAPAGKAGLLAGDAVTHIDGHPTEALKVDDAVERIRGPEGVPVVLTIQRDGEEGRRVFVIVREKVIVPSVKSSRLPDDVGFLRIDHFSQKTSIEVAEHIDRLSAEGALHALIIDVRENTGGSMRHAARIVNYFVPEGILVRTEGSDGQPVAKLTDRIEADRRRLRFDGPVAVLVDSKTASGSEIVAGGLKYLERSITIGTQTFGKGTVQKVYPLRKEGRKVSLKLTVARYLLPGDSFINSVGVTPDIATDVLWLDPEDLVLPDRLREPARFSGREAGRGGLDSRRNPGGGRLPTVGGSNRAPLFHLAYPRVLSTWLERPGETPPPATEEAEEAQEEATPSPREAAIEENQLMARAWPDLPGDAGEPTFNDLDIRLAHDILREAPPRARRAELLDLAAPIVSSWQLSQADRLAQALSERTIPWASQPPSRWIDRSPNREDEVQASLLEVPVGLEASLEFPEALEAGTSPEVRVLIRNKSERPRTHLRARLESSARTLRGLDFLIGDLEPGAEASWTAPLEIPSSASSRLDTWRLYLIDDTGPLGAPFQGTVLTRGLPRPSLDVRLKTSAEPQSDGSSLMSVDVRVRNRGPGETEEIQVHFGTPDDEGVERLERWASVEPLPIGEEGHIELHLRVRDPQHLPQVMIRLRARDNRSRSSTTVALELPSTGKPHDTGWLSPPSISIVRPSSRLESDDSQGEGHFTILGSATSDDGLETVEVSLGRDKLFTAPPPGPDAPPLKRVDIEASGSLRPGPNRVTIRASTTRGVEVSRTSWVLGHSEGAEP